MRTACHLLREPETRAQKVLAGAVSFVERIAMLAVELEAAAMALREMHSLRILEGRDVVECVIAKSSYVIALFFFAERK